MTVQFKLDANGDLAIERGNFVLVDDVAQRLQSRLRMLLGEWFLNVNDGTPYLQEILIKNPNIAHVRSVLRARTLATEGVREIAEFLLDFDPVRRKLTLNMVVLGPTGPVEVTL